MNNALWNLWINFLFLNLLPIGTPNRATKVGPSFILASRPFSSKFRATLLIVVASFLIVFNSSDSRVHSSLRPARIALLFHTKQWDSYYKIRVDGHASAWIERLEAVDESNPRTAACSWSCSLSGKVQLKCESTFLGIFFFNHPKPKSPPEGWLTWPNYFLFFVQRSTIFICRMGMVGGADEYFLLPIRVSPWSSLSGIIFAGHFAALSEGSVWVGSANPNILSFVVTLSVEFS